ncbi:MAG: hypothetical protein K9M97_12150 [Akkermansiaceae bacterium]|nr:hypothetical protein [Akkermansiaceae bacterium]
MTPTIARLPALALAITGTLLPLTGPARAQMPDLLPHYWQETLPATDGSYQRCLVFTTIPGVLYTVESSQDMLTWTAESTLYGMGHDFATPLFQTTAPPPPPAGDPPPPPPVPLPSFRLVSLRMQPADGTEGGTVVSWPSLSGSGGLICHIPEELTADWYGIPLYFESFGTWYFFVSHPPQPVDPPAENPALNGDDATMLAALRENLPLMNQHIPASVERSRNAPPPAPYDPASRRFWRIKADWSKDSDEDGSPDWLEFADAAGNPLVLVGLRSDAFDGDTNRDGVADGSQVDSDGDGQPNISDPAPQDPVIATLAAAPRWRYAVFQIPAAVSLGGGEHAPHMITSQGKVLFPSSVWSRGAFKNLRMTRTDEIQASFALAMDDSGQILGVGTAMRLESSGGGSGGMATFPTVNAWWDGEDAEPLIAESNGKFARPAVAAIPPDSPPQPPYPFDSLLADDTRFMADHAETMSVGGNTVRVDVRALWRRTASGFGFTDDERYSEEDYDMIFAGGTDYVWGWNTVGSRLLTTDDSHDFTYPVSRIPQMPAPAGHPGVPVAFGADGVPDCLVPLPPPDSGAVWQPRENLKRGRDVATNGVRLVGGHELAQDLRQNVFRYWAVNVPQEIEVPQFVNAANNGWILARELSSLKSLAAMPVLLEDDAEATGTDSFSLGGNTWFPLQGTQEKSWVMVPLGGPSATFKLRSLASATNALTLDAGDLLFANGTGTTEVNEPVAMLSLQAPVPADPATEPKVASGAAVNIGLKLGTAGCVSDPLAGYVMKERTVKVNVYKVIKQTPAEPDNPPGLMDTPPDEPDFGTQLASHLTNIFKPQINANFQVNVIPIPLTLNWDRNNDGVFQPNVSEDQQSPEQELILGARPAGQPVSNIDVFILGTSVGFAGAAWGTTAVLQRNCWIVGDALGIRTLETMKRTIAHEIGHVIVGAGHPDNGTSEFILPGTDYTPRLMSNVPAQTTNPGVLLIKAEWEKVEAWMAKNVDPPAE